MGKLIVYTGPMKSGKTTKLIEQYNKTLEKHPKSTYMFKPSIDNRFSSIRVIARGRDEQILATLLNDIDMLWHFRNMYNYFFIDEFQFLDGNINIIKDMLDLNKNFYIAGLNLTAEKKPFGKMGDLLCLADKTYYLSGNCDVCQKLDKGVYTYYKGIKTTDIVVGDGNYLCVCKNCYKKLSNDSSIEENN